MTPKGHNINQYVLLACSKQRRCPQCGRKRSSSLPSLKKDEWPVVPLLVPGAFFVVKRQSLQTTTKKAFALIPTTCGTPVLRSLMPSFVKSKVLTRFFHRCASLQKPTTPLSWYFVFFLALSAADFLFSAGIDSLKPSFLGLAENPKGLLIFWLGLTHVEIYFSHFFKNS